MALITSMLNPTRIPGGGTKEHSVGYDELAAATGPLGSERHADFWCGENKHLFKAPLMMILTAAFPLHFHCRSVPQPARPLSHHGGQERRHPPCSKYGLSFNTSAPNHLGSRVSHQGGQERRHPRPRKCRARGLRRGQPLRKLRAHLHPLRSPPPKHEPAHSAGSVLHEPVC